MSFMVAVTVLLPARALLAMPDDVILATSGEDNVQVTQGVTSVVVPSLKFRYGLELGGTAQFQSGSTQEITTSEMAFAPVTVSLADPALPIEHSHDGRSSGGQAVGSSRRIQSRPRARKTSI